MKGRFEENCISEMVRSGGKGRRFQRCIEFWSRKSTQLACIALFNPVCNVKSAGQMQGKSSVNLEFKYVQLEKRLIIERSTVFDWQNVSVMRLSNPIQIDRIIEFD